MAIDKLEIIVLSCITAILTFILYRLQNHGRRLPPGPKPLPMLGNLLQMPKKHEWLTYAKWAKTYGDVMHLHIFGQSMILLNTLSAANDLLEKRSAIYSDRPRMVMAGELVGFDQGTGLEQYGDRFRAMRKLMHKELTSSALEKYWPLHEAESRTLVRNALREPNSLFDLIRHYSGSIILKITYGYQTAPKQDKWLLLEEQVMEVFSQASITGAWLVDFIPALKMLPMWFPGAGFKKTAKAWRKLNMRAAEETYAWVKDNQHTQAVIKPNFTSTILEKNPDGMSAEDENTLLWVSASLFGGGADTTVSAISSFYLAMALYPDVQKRGQEEIDRVIGSQRLPEIRDRQNLPFVDAIVREMIRWNPVGNLGLPHRLIQDDEYRGYHIPAGSIVMVNVWSILHDEKVFPDPYVFKPERFINNEVAVKTTSAAFGFGRRSCPGMHFAESSMFIAVATALATCNISNAVDDSGRAVTPDVEYTSGTISRPTHFNCTIKARSSSAQALLASSN